MHDCRSTCFELTMLWHGAAQSAVLEAVLDAEDVAELLITAHWPTQWVVHFPIVSKYCPFTSAGLPASRSRRLGLGGRPCQRPHPKLHPRLPQRHSCSPTWIVVAHLSCHSIRLARTTIRSVCDTSSKLDRAACAVPCCRECCQKHSLPAVVLRAAAAASRAVRLPPLAVAARCFLLGILCGCCLAVLLRCCAFLCCLSHLCSGTGSIPHLKRVQWCAVSTGGPTMLPRPPELPL